MPKTITFRIDDAMSKELEFFSRERRLDRSTLVKMLLAKAIENEKLDYALNKYEKGEITIGKAAELAKKDIRKMMIIASNKGIPFQYSLKELREDFKAVN